MKKILFLISLVLVLVSCKDGILVNQYDKGVNMVLGKNNNNEPTKSGDNPSGKDTTVVDPGFDNIIVSTEAENRKAVIEEYTGINCGYCPDGHRIVNEIMAKYPGQVFGVNVHAGTYAVKYKTTEGTAYLNEADVSGFPAGAVNRHLFSSYSQNNGIAMSRSHFENAVKKIMQMFSPVNVGASAVINTATRELTVKIKGYYTADPEEGVTTNSLYVLLLQDSVMGEQSGGSTYNPDQWIDGQYRHMHMLRAAINENGTWGDEISPISAGSWFYKTVTYIIPETIGTDKVPTVLKDMRVIIYVAAGHKEIYTVAKPDVVLK